MAVSSGTAEGNYINAIGMGNVVDVTLSLDTSIYADNDVAAAPQEVTGFFRKAGGRAYLQSVFLLDESDQGVDLDLLFLNATGSIGAENAAFAPTDAVARTIIGSVPILTADYVDAVNSQFVMKNNLGIMMKAAADTSSVWIAAVIRSGTPTFAAAGITLKLGVMWD